MGGTKKQPHPVQAGLMPDFRPEPEHARRPMPPTEEQLRVRIHRLFSNDDVPEDTTSPPEFWIQPPNDQLQPGAARNEEPIGMATEDEWLRTPNPAFNGRKPDDMLISGQDRDLEMLDTALRAIEEGAFS